MYGGDVPGTNNTRTATHPSQDASSRTPARRSFFALAETRWALGSLVTFLLGLAIELGGGPAWLSWTSYLACYAAGGWEPAREGLRALRNKTLDVDLLMIVAAIGAAAIGEVMDGGLLIVIFATSGALEAFATARTEDSVRGLLELAPDTAVRVHADGTEETVGAANLGVGDEILVRPGERIGGDGTVLEGSSDVDQATITGEPLPRAKNPGDHVFAGTLNGSGAIRLRVRKDPSESVIARIVAMVSEASKTKARTQLFIEKIEQRYSAGVVAATLAVFTIPVLFGEALDSALLRAMTFMIVASPCAVVLATMPPLLSSIANAGRHGALVKSAVAMEQLGETERVALDKTGTLTEGAPRVAGTYPYPAGPYEEDDLLALAAGAEHLSEHPLGMAIVTAATERDLPVPEARDFTATPGRGVTATVSGNHVEVTNPDQPDDLVAQLEDAGLTAVVVTVDGKAAGIIGITDRLRPDAAEAIREFQELTGNPPILLTGDNERAATKMAAAVGITDVRASLLPSEKAAAVRGFGSTMVLGDGVNDAPALAAARSGVAMGKAGSDLTLETADVVVVQDSLLAAPRLIELSRRARGLIKQNLMIAGTFITALVIWDLAGHLPLPLGVAGHEGSTIIVGLNGLRLLYTRT